MKFIYNVKIAESSESKRSGSKESRIGAYGVNVRRMVFFLTGDTEGEAMSMSVSLMYMMFESFSLSFGGMAVRAVPLPFLEGAF